ncbi:MAG: AraC family transcriptional regulator [Nocardia sp.]|uniref:AraC family transcriptional regulator ligand-binding domain-containing protein n=1 Tax=Nocardia sp. TaxID=1821 RepID=UPI00261BB05B|nr:AraC family transcriptional regulator ligand-binding domain-containing protein [Nocardia sp.]MCU1643301.1 AraC family transcriptional regulator [Nocardia sp.]
MSDAPTYSAVLARCVLNTAGHGLDPYRLLHAAHAPDALLTSEHGLVSTGSYLRLWEHAEFAQDTTEEIGLRIGDIYRVGQLGIFDYLFGTAATVADGLAAMRGPLSMATNHRYRPGAGDPDREITTILELREGEGRGVDMAVQAAYASNLARIRTATGAPVTPVRVTLRQRPPRRMKPFRAAFGTNRIDFDAPQDSMTLAVTDLALPLRTADPVLAGILRTHVAAIATPSLDQLSWPEQVQQVLAETIGTGDASLTAVSRRLLVSPRTLQRYLAAADTTWRAQLDLARQHTAQQNGATSTFALAHRLGYADARSLRRAAHRWEPHTAQKIQNAHATM